MSDSLRPHGLQHVRLPCPYLSPRVCSNSCPLSQWCHPTISSSVIPFSSRLQCFPPSGSFPMSQLFISADWYGGQCTGASASVSILPTNIQDWFPLGFDLFTVQETLKRQYMCIYYKFLVCKTMRFDYSNLFVHTHTHTHTHTHDCFKLLIFKFQMHFKYPALYPPT